MACYDLTTRKGACYIVETRLGKGCFTVEVVYGEEKDIMPIEIPIDDQNWKFIGIHRHRQNTLYIVATYGSSLDAKLLECNASTGYDSQGGSFLQNFTISSITNIGTLSPARFFSLGGYSTYSGSILSFMQVGITPKPTLSWIIETVSKNVVANPSGIYNSFIAEGLVTKGYYPPSTNVGYDYLEGSNKIAEAGNTSVFLYDPGWTIELQNTLPADTREYNPDIYHSYIIATCPVDVLTSGLIRYVDDTQHYIYFDPDSRASSRKQVLIGYDSFGNLEPCEDSVTDIWIGTPPSEGGNSLESQPTEIAKGIHIGGKYVCGLAGTPSTNIAFKYEKSQYETSYNITGNGQLHTRYVHIAENVKPAPLLVDTNYATTSAECSENYVMMIYYYDYTYQSCYVKTVDGNDDFVSYGNEGVDYSIWGDAIIYVAGDNKIYQKKITIEPVE